MKGEICQCIALVGDDYGVGELAARLPRERIGCIVGASIRPQYLDNLKRIATSIGVPFLIQPKFGSEAYGEFVDRFGKLDPDMIFCHSYSMLIRKDLLETVGYNALNIHAALLPKNRGPNPIQWAIIRGEKRTGVTIHYMDEGLDTGKIVAQEPMEIDDCDTWVTLREKLSAATRRLLARTVDDILGGRVRGVPQREEEATTNFRLTPEFPRIDFEKMSDRQIYDLIRAQVAPLGGAYIETERGRLHFPEMLSMEEIKILREKYER
jgi:UDP-4-amino-4-deoxy-L-arabinose formyltransferase/UDP-glucuronic acid dehydrogenase (UDP-4-keto-hexauronic acid decarboxylating)